MLCDSVICKKITFCNLFGIVFLLVLLLTQCTDRLERDRLIGFLNKLILHKRNVKEIMDANGIKVLVDLLTLAHLHTSRATVPLQVCF